MRKKDSDLFKASITKKAAAAGGDQGGDDDSDWESVEEDFPHVKLTELLDGLTLEVGNNNAGDDDDDDDEDWTPDEQIAEEGMTTG